MEACWFSATKEIQKDAICVQGLRGVLMIGYLQKGQTINGEYYALNLRQLKEAIKSKRQGKLCAGVLLLQDNAPVHTAQVAVTEAERCGFELLPHAPYSPDLAPSEFYLFPTCRAAFLRVTMMSYVPLKGILGLRVHTSSEKGSQSLEHRLSKCIEVHGDYVEI